MTRPKIYIFVESYNLYWAIIYISPWIKKPHKLLELFSFDWTKLSLCELCLSLKCLLIILLKDKWFQFHVFRSKLNHPHISFWAMFLYRLVCLCRHAMFKWQIMAWLLKTHKIMWHQFISIRNKAFEKDLERYINTDMSILDLKNGKAKSQLSLN